MALKVIKYNGVEYLYEISTNIFDGGTYVYDSKPIVYTERKYIFFGPRVIKTKHEFLFYTHMDFEAPYYSKEVIEDKFKSELRLIARKKEIENGEIL